MLESMDRRQLLSDAIKLGGSAAFAGIVSRGLLADTSRDNAFGYGELYPTTSLNTGETILMLPKSFQYTVFGRKGTIMSDGNVTPIQHDGMAAFASADGDIRIVRNHEVTGDHVSDSKCIVDASNPYAYDHTAPAGCSTIEARLYQPCRDPYKLCGRRDALGQLALLRGNSLWRYAW